MYTSSCRWSFNHVPGYLGSSPVVLYVAGGNHTRLQQFSDSVAAFKAARLFVAQNVKEMQPTANAIDDLAVCAFLNKPTILSQLKAELPEYLIKAEDVSAGMTPLRWWKRQEHCLPT